MRISDWSSDVCSSDLLLALTLVIGILVDDAIVEVENIEKRIEAGQTPYRAALIGADSIGLAVLATTATIIAVFAPVSVMPGQAGQFFRHFGLTVAVAELGRASCRERVCQYVKNSGVGGCIQQKNNQIYT